MQMSFFRSGTPSIFKKIISAVLAGCILFLSSCAFSGNEEKIETSDSSAASESNIIDEIPASNRLTSFCYSGGGRWIGLEYKYSVYIEDGITYLKALNIDHYGEDGVMPGQNFSLSCEADQKLLDELHELINECITLSWNSYDVVNEDVIDGGGFSLSASYEDGFEFLAHGNVYPENYSAISKQIVDIFERYISEHLTVMYDRLSSDDLDFLQLYYCHDNQYYEYWFGSSNENRIPATNLYMGSYYFPPDDALDTFAYSVDETVLNELHNLIKDENLFAWLTFPDQYNYNTDEYYELNIKYDSMELWVSRTTPFPDNFEQVNRKISNLSLRMEYGG